MVSEALRNSDAETGGILVGYRSGADYVITEVLGPGPNAKHAATSFQPDYDYHEAELERVFRDRGGAEYYLGDWHTHPDGTLGLSSKDVRVLRQIARHPESGLRDPLMLIIATGLGEVTAAVWRYEMGRWRARVAACALILG